MRLLIPIADGFNATELATISELLYRTRQAGADLDVMIGYAGSRDFRQGAKSSTLTTILPDEELSDEVCQEHWDAVLIPGGRKSVESLLTSSHLVQLVQDQFRKQHLVAAICSGPLLLAVAGIVEKGKTITSFHDIRDCLESRYGLVWLDKAVVRNGTIITGRGPGASIPFSFAVIEHLFGKDIIRAIDERFVAAASLQGLAEYENFLWSLASQRNNLPAYSS